MTFQVTWRKSSRSQTGPTCVEVSSMLNALRDSKNDAGPILRGNVIALLRQVKSGHFD